MNEPDRLIFYDATCGFCSATERRWAKRLAPLGFRFVARQEPGAAEILGLKPDEAPGEIKVRTETGQMLGGADALIFVGSKLWWAKPLAAIAKLPGIYQVCGFVYRRIAANRKGISRACGLRPNLSQKEKS